MNYEWEWFVDPDDDLTNSIIFIIGVYQYIVWRNPSNTYNSYVSSDYTCQMGYLNKIGNPYFAANAPDECHYVSLSEAQQACYAHYHRIVNPRLKIME